MIMKKAVIDAYCFAEKAHKGQLRKFSGLPYFSHPKGVARIVAELMDSELLVASALLHDVVEDTPITIDEIEAQFGLKVKSLVSELTSDPVEQKKLGKKNYLLQKIINMSTEARFLKLADRFHNVLYLHEDTVPEKFLLKYYKETRFILRGLEEESMFISHGETILIEKIKAVLDFLQIRHKLK